MLADVTTLATLPPREYRAGLGEVAKYALMPGGERVAALVADDSAARSSTATSCVLGHLVAASAAIKAAVVAADPHERTGIRATLNLGHTLAHALESVGRLRAAARRGRRGRAWCSRARSPARSNGSTLAPSRSTATCVEALGLPTQVPGPADADADALLASMRRDKKAVGGLTFVLPGADGLEIVHDPDPRAISVAFRAVGVEG